MFKVDMLCSTELKDDKDVIDGDHGTLSVLSNHLIPGIKSAFLKQEHGPTERYQGKKDVRRMSAWDRDLAVDEWVDHLDEYDIQYFYDLLLDGQEDKVLDAYRYEAYDGSVEQFDELTPAQIAEHTDTFTRNWMSFLPDSTTLNMINIPGTHDTMTYAIYGKGFRAASMCQSFSIFHQMINGYRYFDLRVWFVEDGYKTIDSRDSTRTEEDRNNPMNNIWSRHGDTIGRTSEETLFDAVVSARHFLLEHPTEALIFKLKRESGDKLKLHEELTRIFSAEKAKGPEHTIFFNPDLEVMLTPPALQAVRGKVVIFYDWTVQKTVTEDGKQRKIKVKRSNFKESALGQGHPNFVPGSVKRKDPEYKMSYGHDASLLLNSIATIAESRKRFFSQDLSGAQQVFANHAQNMYGYFVRIYGNTQSGIGALLGTPRKWAEQLNPFMFGEFQKIVRENVVDGQWENDDVRFGIIGFDFPPKDVSQPAGRSARDPALRFDKMGAVVAMTNKAIWQNMDSKMKRALMKEMGISG